MATQKNSKAPFIIIGLGILVFAVIHYPVYFITGAAVLLGILIFAYFKIPKFHAFINGKFSKSKKPDGMPTASIRQNNGTAAAYLCNSCGGQLQPVANWPKFMACEKCHKVQQKI
jgi:hypothetical protein